MILFAGWVLYQVKAREAIALMLIAMLDYCWVLSSFIVLFFTPFGFSFSGQMTTGTVAFIVLFLAIAQTRGIIRLDKVPGKEHKRFQFKRTIRAPQKVVWKIISDIGNYHEVAPNIDEAKILSGQGEGMKRTCRNGKDQWQEVCTAWIEGEMYEFEVDTSPPDYPYPLQYLKSSWKAEKVDTDQTNILMTFDFRYSRKYQELLLHPFMRKWLTQVGKSLLDNWQSKIEGR